MTGALWFALLALMLTTYAVLDGFDFGVGIMHLFVARTDVERRVVLSSIGPVWDGNEVWLVGAGGVFVFAFPGAYAAAFSGLYLALMIVLWLVILRGIAIKVRSKLEDPLWRAAWDAIFAFASASMAIVLGVVIGNVVRGVPLDGTGYFQEDLFALAPSDTGAMNLYTTLLGAFALVTLAAHGSTYLALKTTGQVHARSVRAANRLWVVTLAFAVVSTVVTALTQPAFFATVPGRPWVWPLPIGSALSALLARTWVARGRELAAFLASSAFVALLLIATAATLFPVILRSTVSDAFTIDVGRAATSAGLGAGLAICVPAVAIAVGYFVFLYRTVRGKVDVGDETY